MMTRTHTTTNGPLLKASRVESAAQPIHPPTSFHEAQHRSRRAAAENAQAGMLNANTNASDARAENVGSAPVSGTKVYLQPTPQREHATVAGWVYSKKPSWTDVAGKQGSAGSI